MPRRYFSIVHSAIWMSGTLISFAAMAVAVRELSVHINTFQMLVIRSAIGLLIISSVIAKAGWKHVSLGNIKLHYVRNIVHFCWQFGWFYAIALIPLATVFAIEFTVPIWTAMLAAVLLGERITVTRVVVITCGLLGVLIILQPGLTVIHPAAFVMLASAMAYGLSHTLTKKLAERDNSLGILFYMMSIQLLLGLGPAIYNWVTPTLFRGLGWSLLELPVSLCTTA